MDCKKKVLLVCDKNECTSFGRLSLSIQKALKPNFDAEILWLKTPKFFGKKVQSDDCEIWAKSLYTGFFSFRIPFKKILRSKNPDIVFFIRPELGFLVPVAKSACPNAKHVMFIHDTFAETLYPNSIKFKLLNRYFIRDTVKADSFVYNSRWTKGEAEKHFGIANAKSSVIGCPIDLELFCAPEIPVTDADKLAFRKKFGFGNFKAVCLNVSLDEPRKNIETYFEMARLRPEVAFVRVGKFSERLKQIIEEKKIVNVFHFNQFKARELCDFYRFCDLMVYPSLLEGFGMPPVEALSCGAPAVASATSAVKENLEGVVPLVNPPTDALQYAQILDKVISGENIVDEVKKAELLKYCSNEAFSRRVNEALSSF